MDTRCDYGVSVCVYDAVYDGDSLHGQRAKRYGLAKWISRRHNTSVENET